MNLKFRHCFTIVAAFGFFKTGATALAQADSAKTSDDAAAKSGAMENLLDLRVGPFDLHPRLAAGLTYDDNILFSPTNKLADALWTIQPAVQAVAGDDAALLANGDQNNSGLSLSPGGIIVQPPEDWPGKLFVLDYGPRFQVFDRYTANNSIDQLGSLNFLWPMSKLILGVRQDYQLQKQTIIQAGQRATEEDISTALSAAYQFGDKTSLEADFRRNSVGYDQAGLTGYTEYNTEEWFNYLVAEDLPISVGVLAGWDQVGNHQDQTYEQLRGRVRYNYTEKLVFDASFGGELREYQDGASDTFTPVFSIAGEYHPAERTTLSLTGYRQISAANFGGYNYDTTGATLQASQGITDRFTANVSIGYYTVDYTPVTAGLVKYSNDYYTARIGLDAKIVRHLNGQVFYQLTSSQSSVSGDVKDNQAGMQMTLSF